MTFAPALFAMTRLGRLGPHPGAAAAAPSFLPGLVLGMTGEDTYLADGGTAQPGDPVSTLQGAAGPDLLQPVTAARPVLARDGQLSLLELDGGQAALGTGPVDLAAHADVTIGCLLRCLDGDAVLLGDPDDAARYLARWEAGSNSTELHAGAGLPSLRIDGTPWTGTDRDALAAALSDGVWHALVIRGADLSAWQGVDLIGPAGDMAACFVVAGSDADCVARVEARLDALRAQASGLPAGMLGFWSATGSSLWQDAGATLAAASGGDPVRVIAGDFAGGAWPALVTPSLDASPELRTAPRHLFADGQDDQPVFDTGVPLPADMAVVLVVEAAQGDKGCLMSSGASGQYAGIFDHGTTLPSTGGIGAPRETVDGVPFTGHRGQLFDLLASASGTGLRDYVLVGDFSAWSKIDFLRSNNGNTRFGGRIHAIGLTTATGPAALAALRDVARAQVAV
ncbi:hypothetical protein [Roseobacter sp. HKCCA0434]|uniref:hypothetical protein n=1 Tax=Roseobacter sp. HKCCA0434 TaxID=3079297 RepID=UPI002905A4F1|nr:hypothetical protein [Roseobacter sp. HKCCA0434]